MNYFVTGIDTDSGKTLTCAILCQALGADYWKPVQAGLPGDTEAVRSLVSHPSSRFHQETYVFQTPASPHAAAHIDGISIRLDHFVLPETKNHLIIEGAGGCLVPLNDQDFVVDLARELKAPLVVVADLYLGSINHTLLTIEAIRRRNLEIKGIVFNGPSTPESEGIIIHHTALPILLHINKEEKIDKEVVRKYAELFSKSGYGGLA